MVKITLDHPRLGKRWVAQVINGIPHWTGHAKLAGILPRHIAEAVIRRYAAPKAWDCRIEG